MLINGVRLWYVKNVSDLRLVYFLNRNFSDGGNSGNGEDAASKLNALLMSIVKEEKPVASAAPKIVIPKSRAKQRVNRNVKTPENAKDLGSRIVDAAKDVAVEIKGENKEIEAQLLHKLLYKDSPVGQEIMKASSSNDTLADLISKMNVEMERVEPQNKPITSNDFSRASHVKSLVSERIVRSKSIASSKQRINLFAEKPLGIFDLKTCNNRGIELDTWNACEEREKRLSITHPPANHFEQLIDWTNKGIIWKFPIDNEQGLEAEKEVSFASHVLLETHLDNWCPTAGPIRHFMELVCVGLSRNHWLTAVEKEQHIMWYKDFFTQRKQLIKELGAGDVIDALSDSKTM